jgi:hypothetical protein
VLCRIHANNYRQTHACLSIITLKYSHKEKLF